ncbi:Aste57867_23865 [Aphanomyces stellatus]|uniref:Aste57867_23865 protein n=1 Tax=Aphanomyces stellatus TaxID=120398 RepID=A0A485LQP3_9STRA|nr:hypothetical protein As57867_023792 [Aphanomyces stellatus]VFU00508.1 Aste57867_23865 [Aphanomyces stellatus]
MDLNCCEEPHPPRASLDDAYEIDMDTATTILAMLLETEAKYPRPNNYLFKAQTHGMDSSWRRRICDWMLDTGKAFELSLDTIACAVHLMDQYLCVLSVDKIVLQLLAMVCMYMASKVHEHRPISMEEMELLCRNKYPRCEMIKMERRVLEIVSWKLNPPTAFAFARDLIGLEESAQIRPLLEASVNQLLSDCLSEYCFVEALESVKAIAALQVVCLTQFQRASPLVKYALDALDFPTDFYNECVRLMVVIAQKKYSVPLPTHVPLYVRTSADVSPQSTKRHPTRSTTPTGVDTPPHLLNDRSSSSSTYGHIHKRARRGDCQ